MGRTSSAHDINFHAKTNLVRHFLGRFICFVFIFLASTAQAEDEQLVDRVVAVVDGHPILHSEVAEKVSVGPLVAVSDFPASETATPYVKATQDAINLQLVLSKAKELELDVRDEEVEGEIKHFLESKELTKDTLLQYLAQQGKTYDDYRSDFRNQMILRHFQGRVIKPLIKIIDKDVETYYLKKTGAVSDLVELTLRQILLKTDAGATADVIQAKQAVAREVYQKLQGGMDFKEAVKVYSDDTSARETGGLMDGVRLKDLSGQIRTEVENLEVHTFTQPVQTAAGVHIFYLEERKFAGSKDFQKQKAALEMELWTIEMNAQTKRWLTEQRQRTKVDEIP